MAKWVKSLIRISTFEVETLQKTLAEVVTRRTHVEMKIATLDAEFELENVRAKEDYSLSMHMPAYKKGWDGRRAQVANDLNLIAHEERGIRDQLTEAFEELKKFEHVSEVTKLNRQRQELARENAAMDEAALRMSYSRA
jgi:flagellar protein FliJ